MQLINSTLEWKKLKHWKNSLIISDYFFAKNLTLIFFLYNQTTFYIKDSWQQAKTNRDKKEILKTFIMTQNTIFLSLGKKIFLFLESLIFINFYTMAVSRAKKSEILSTLIENIKNAKSIGFAQTNGLTVSEFSDLRADLRTVNTSYNLAKKTLVRIAVKEALGIDLDLNLLPGQVWVICSNDDAVAWLSKANAYITKAYNKKVQVQKISWVASIFEGKVNGLEETKVIASMPSRETLLSRLVGSMMSPLSGMARFFDAAAKEVEAQGKSKVGELEGKKETTSETPSEETQA